MVIKIVRPDDRWRASLKGTSLGIVGVGGTEREAIGDLIYQLASADDSVNATEAIDVAVVAG